MNLRELLRFMGRGSGLAGVAPSRYEPAQASLCRTHGVAVSLGADAARYCSFVRAQWETNMEKPPESRTEPQPCVFIPLYRRKSDA